MSDSIRTPHASNLFVDPLSIRGFNPQPEPPGKSLIPLPKFRSS